MNAGLTLLASLAVYAYRNEALPVRGRGQFRPAVERLLDASTKLPVL